MPFFPFSDVVPFATNNPSADQGPMLLNNVSDQGIWEVDHYGFNDNLGGYHTIIHQPQETINSQPAWNPATASGVPTAIGATKISGVQQLFAMSYTPNATITSADTQLFTMTGKGGISQLSGNLSGGDGWVWSSGILYQWGVVNPSITPPSTTGTVLFKDRVPGAIPFPNNCFIVMGTPLYTNSSSRTASASVNIRQSSVVATGFEWEFYSNSATGYIGFYWFAIGN